MAQPEFTWSATYTDRTGRPCTESGTLQARSLASARNRIENDLWSRGCGRVCVTVEPAEEAEICYLYPKERRQA